MKESSLTTKKSKRPLIFLGVGVVNTLLDFAFFTFLTLVVFKNDNIALSGIISGTFALICAYITHSLITWRGNSIDYKVFLRFFVFTGFGMWVIRPALLAIFVHFTGLYDFVFSVSAALRLPFSEAFITNTGSFGFMIIILLVYNYVVYGRFVFNDHKHVGQPQDKDS